MSATFPGGVKTFPTLVDLVDSVLASHQNDRAVEITAIEGWLLNVLDNLPEGTLINGRIAPSASAGDLTLALKDKAGNDPSASSPVGVMLGGTLRWISAPLSVTIAAGANTFNAGGLELQTKELDLFAYLRYNATDAVCIGPSRIPYGLLYSDFSAVATNEKYCAWNTIANATASDPCAVIGRFAATLSAGAAYTWTVPAYDASNLVQRPIFESRWLSWAVQYTGYSANPSCTANYKVARDACKTYTAITGAGVSNATTATMSFPFAFALSNAFAVFTESYDNGAHQAAVGHLASTAGSNVASLYKSIFQGAWTAAGGKGQNIPAFEYRLR